MSLIIGIVIGFFGYIAYRFISKAIKDKKNGNNTIEK